MLETVWAVRHGERADVADPSWADRADRVHDPPLTDFGRWQAWRVGRRLSATGVPFDAVYASPFLRAVETADEICREIDRSVRLEPGLGEHRNPAWFDAEPTLLPEAALVDRFDPVCTADEPVIVPEFPEDHDAAERRVAATTRGLADRHAGDEHLLVVGHGLTIGGVVRGLVGSTEWVDAPLAGITRIDRRGDDWHLAYSGDTFHC